ncbi:MAG: hypothetical protein HUU14_07580 [Dehalococcoidia bacterium]|nr:MAG: hypothetical protein EDM76_04880 [bacterium]MCE7926924.1 hypothetical protein [Chloroflexi bacterium CFX7]MCL4232650.1 hypothetical protein [Dehalococcoidia bacterium]NUQ55729.1 hypothetical protein [Dehalococcoidia bacterium]RIL02863.1 MAG: hypothetical protein DCC78_05305 [bacterium]
MIVLLEEREAWSLMMLASSVAIDNAGLSEEANEAIRRWRSDSDEKSPAIAKLTDEINRAINTHLDAKFLRRVKLHGGRAETVRK